jgi:hypothetical protein
MDNTSRSLIVSQQPCCIQLHRLQGQSHLSPVHPWTTTNTLLLLFQTYIVFGVINAFIVPVVYFFYVSILYLFV